MKKSMLVRGQAAFRTWGRAGLSTGRKDQKSRAEGSAGPAPNRLAPSQNDPSMNAGTEGSFPGELSAIRGAISMDSTGEPAVFRVSFGAMKPDAPLPGFGPEGDQDQIRISDAELERLMGFGGKPTEAPRAFESLETGERVRGRVLEIQRDAL